MRSNPIPNPNYLNSLNHLNYLIPARIGLHTSDLVTGSGLGTLLALAGAALDPWTSLAAISLGAIPFLVWAGLTRLPAPVWLCLSSSTLNLVLTLSVGLTLLARICPPEGKEFALIPAYFLLCMSRLQTSTLWPVRALQVLFILLFLLSLQIRLQSSDLEPGFKGFAGAFDDPNLSLICIALSVFYDGVSQWCRLSSELVHLPRYPEIHPYYLPLESALWALPRWALLLGLAMLGGGALPYLFLAPLPTYSDPYSPNYLGALYALVLLLSSMCIASGWFQSLQRVSDAPHRLSRLQHVLNLLLVGAAWAFPIDAPPPALTLYSICSVLGVFAAVQGMISSLGRGPARLSP